MKEKIKLSNENTYEFDNVSVFNNLLTIVFDEKIDMPSLIEDMSIFNTLYVLTRNDEICGQYDNFNTVYKLEGTTLTLSNDGSVYTEPEESVTPDEPEYIPTLDEVKNAKISELSSICEKSIVSGVDVQIGEEIEHFSYSIEDQSNIDDAFTLARNTQMSVPYHCDNGNCKLYTLEQITNIYIAEKTNKTHHTTYFNQMKMYVKSLEDIEAVKNIFYGDGLTGEYLETYNAMMAQSALIVQKTVEGENE